jgi:antitoxin component of MazEF toxin-antitoxin module
MALKEPDELTYIDLSVQKSGNSLQVTIPSEVTGESGTEKGDTVSARFDREEGTFTVFLG